MARALASWVLLQAGWFPLVIPETVRPTYLEAHVAADADDLRLLVGLVAEVQIAAFREALALLAAVGGDDGPLPAAAGDRHPRG